jgi:predicted negative regulator of RcsB-dependent stress response
MDKRLKDIQQGTLTESRLNSDFLFWLKEKGPNWLLAALLVLCAVLGYNWWEQRQRAARDAAWSELAAAATPQALVEIAERQGTVDAIATLATLDAADRYLEAIRSGKRFDREAGAPDAAVTPELRAQYLDEADRLYTRAASRLDGRPAPETILLASAWFGRAAVAESKGDLATAESHLKTAQAAVKEAYPAVAATADERIATLAALSSRPTMPSRPAPAVSMTPVVPGDPTQVPAGDITASEVDALTGGAPAAPAQPK